MSQQTVNQDPEYPIPERDKSASQDLARQESVPEAGERQPRRTPRPRRTDAAAAAVKMLPALVDAYRWNRKQQISDLGLQLSALLAEAYPGIARQLSRARELTPTPLQMPEDMISFETPRFGLNALVLSQACQRQCRELIEEHTRAAELAAAGLDPRHTLLLHGPSGNGKTTLAEAIAFELQVPLLRVRYGGIIASYLGDTGRHIDRVIQYASSNPCVLFFDEFDAVGGERSVGKEDVGEMRRVTNQLLIHVERIPPGCVLIAATNLLRIVDKALLRRFDFKLLLPTPDRAARLECARRQLDSALTPGHDLTALAARLADMPLDNFDAVVKLCQSLRRDLVLNGGNGQTQLLDDAMTVEP